MKTALTIAGSDPSGGAGLQTDLKAFQELGVYGMSVVTLLTVQNRAGVRHVETIHPELIVQQLDAVVDDLKAHAIKTGALGTSDIIRAVSDRLRDRTELRPLIVDPVLVSKHGHPLADNNVAKAYRDDLLPLASLITPNRFEAEAILGLPRGSLASNTSTDEWIKIANDLRTVGPAAVLLKAGICNGERLHVLACDEQVEVISTPDLKSENTHGAGCNLSAALTALLAIDDSSLTRASQRAIDAVLQAIEHAPLLETAGNHGSEPGAISSPIQGPIQTQLLRRFRFADTER